MSFPLFPSLTPKVVDSLWFSIDKPRNDESELVQQEQEHQNWVRMWSMLKIVRCYHLSLSFNEGRPRLAII